MNKSNIGCLILCVVIFFGLRSCIGCVGSSNEDILESIDEAKDGISADKVRKYLRDDDQLVIEHGEKFIIRTCDECGKRYKTPV